MMRFLLLLAALIPLAGCNLSGSIEGAKSKTAAQAPAAEDPSAIVVPAAQLARLRLGEPNWTEVAADLKVPARLEVDETRVARLGSPVTGRVTALHVLEGQAVKRGEVIATLHSTELAAAQSGYLKAISQQQLAERALGRARQLLAAEVIGEAELLRRESEVAQASAELDSFRDQLAMLGVSNEALATLAATRKVHSTTPITATIDGIALKRLVTVGQVVQPADAVIVLADLTSLWLVADVPEQDVGALRAGMTVQAEITSLPGHKLSGRLNFIAPTVEPELRTVHVRMDVANHQGIYKPSMIATMEMRDRPRRERVIPIAAVVRESNKDYVYVQTAQDRFQLREVTLGAEYGDVRVLSGGLRDGETIVLDGAFHLNNERKKASLQAE